MTLYEYVIRISYDTERGVSMQQTDNPQADEFDLQAYLAWCWWLVKVSAFVLSVSLNVFFLMLLLEIRAGY